MLWMNGHRFSTATHAARVAPGLLLCLAIACGQILSQRLEI
jgi:hypothetical protein